jgi:hypothetical protein
MNHIPTAQSAPIPSPPPGNASVLRIARHSQTTTKMTAASSTMIITDVNKPTGET